MTRVDGRDHGGSFGAAYRRRQDSHDSYGINTTSHLLRTWAQRLDAALAAEPMPEFLVEALTAVQEAGMVEHRDVFVHGARPVTPRVAIALQDHAFELVASIAATRPEDLVSWLEEDEVDRQWEQLILNAVLAPLDDGRASPDVAREVELLKHTLTQADSSGARVVSLEKVWEARDRLRALPVSPAVRTTLEDGLAAISSASDEAKVRDRARQSVAVVRARHRRARNAIAHGNPASAAVIDSVRGFSERMAREALGLALHGYATGEKIPDLVAARKSARDARDREMASGFSVVDRIMSASDAGSPSA